MSDTVETTPSLPPAVAARLRDIEAKRAQLKANRDTRDAAAKLPPTPEQLIADAEAQLAREEREETDVLAFNKAVKKHGKDRVGAIRTVDGMIVMRPRTGAEVDRHTVELSGLEKDPAQQELQARELLMESIEHPSREQTRAIVTKFPGVWAKIIALAHALASGEESALLGKA